MVLTIFFVLIHPTFFFITTQSHMATPNNNILKIHEHCYVVPQSSPSQLSLPLTFFDLIWLRFHPVERIFFYSHPSPHEVIPKLKASLSNTLKHFLPLAGNIVWPSDSNKPIIQYNHGDGVSLVIAESNEDNFNIFLENSPREASESRSLVPNLESSDSKASVMSLQITIFPDSGFSIGVSSHHAVLDGKSTTLFTKAWAYLCRTENEEDFHDLVPELKPSFDKEAIKDPNGRDMMLIKIWEEISFQFNPTDESNSKGKTLKIMFSGIPPLLDHMVRATFELTRGDLENIKKKILSKWDSVEDDSSSSKPQTLSTFVLTFAYVSVCIAKAIEESQNGKKEKFTLGFTVDCRARLDPPVPENYFGNCVCSHFVDGLNSEENGLVIVAKKIQETVKSLDDIEKTLDGIENFFARAASFMKEGVTPIGVAGSTRFGVYGIDFGWGKPQKVEIVSVDRSITIGMAESKDGNGGVEVGLVLNKNVMGHFHHLFHGGLLSSEAWN